MALSERKEAFLSQFEGETYKTYRTAFCKVQPYEDYFQMDVSMFPLPKLYSMFTELEWLNNYNTFNVYRSLLRNYVQWCIRENYCDANAPVFHFEFVDEQSADVRRKSYRNAEDLMDTLYQILDEDKTDLSSRLMMPRILLYLSWLGFKKEELPYIRKDEFSCEDGQYRIITPSWTTDIIAPRMARQIQEAIDETEMRFDTVTLRGQWERVIKYGGTPYILRSTAETAVPANTIENWLRNLKKIQKQQGIASEVYDKPLSPSRVWRYGRYVALLQWEQKGNEITPKNADQWRPIVRLPGIAPASLVMGYKSWKTAWQL